MNAKKISILLIGLSLNFQVVAEVKPPSYQLLRQNENWSVLKNMSPSERAADPWNKIKYIPLDKGYLSFGGSMRDRVESWKNYLSSTSNNDTFNLWQMFLYGDFQMNDNFRTFIELKSALSSNRNLPGGIRELDEDQFALQQAFVDLKIFPTPGSSLTLRPGRQLLSFGNQRLISPLPWANTYRAWDGVSILFKHDNWKSQTFFTQFVPVRRVTFNQPSAANKLNGTYVTHSGTTHSQDFYYLHTQRDTQGFLNGTGGTTLAKDKRHTVGSRLFGDFSNHLVDYEAEGAFQFGKWGNKNIRAYMVALFASHTYTDVMLKPQIYGGYDYASGGSPTASTQQTFLQLFPLGHAYLGWIDYVGRQNISSPHVGLSVEAYKKTRIGAKYHYFWRANNRDALYSLGSTVLRNGLASTSSKIGSEVDVYIKGDLTQHISLWSGVNHFWPGTFIKNTGPNVQSNLYYAMLKYTV